MDNFSELTTPAAEDFGAIDTQTIDEENVPAPPSDVTAPPLDRPDVQAETPVEETPPPSVDYEALAAEDLKELRRLVPSLSSLSHIGDLPGARRFAELREAGLTVEEAFWAACHTAVAERRPAYDTRSHLHSAVPRGASNNPAVMTASEMHAARELFSDLTESEIQKLYARCRS